MAAGCQQLNTAYCVTPSALHTQTGTRVGRFTRAHGKAKVTAAAFDHNQRRLVTAASDGGVCMWNFNNGSLLSRRVAFPAGAQVGWPHSGHDVCASM